MFCFWQTFDRLTQKHCVRIHGIYIMDTNCVELTYRDGAFVTIDCEEVENFYGITTCQMADLSWLGSLWSMRGWCCLESWEGTTGVLRNTWA